MNDVIELIKESAEAGQNGFDAEREGMHRQILSSVSHDLKTPLASIIGSLEVYERLKEKLSLDKQQTLIRLALQEAYRLDSFVTNILDMAKLEGGMVKAKREKTNIGSMLRACLARLNNRLQDSAVHIADNPILVEAATDPVLLSRAVCLVLDNAVKYCGPSPVIQIAFGRDENDAGFINIRDNGRGIPDGQMETVFSKYTRYARGDQQTAGMGLGLGIGREIMRLLGGDMTVVNHPEGGAAFLLQFSAA